MYQGKYGNTNPAASAPRRRRRHRRLNPRFVVMASILTLLIGMVGGSLAYLITSTDPVKNVFTPGSVTPDITEEFEDNVKKDVAVKNTGNVPVYIRAKVIVTWENPDGTVLGEQPMAGVDYDITYPPDGWIQGSDGFYYYTTPVGANASTGVLFTDCEPKKPAPQEGYTLHVEILSQSIQADGVEGSGKYPVTLAWGSHVTVNDDGTLSVG